jgi:hypothetical protein
MLLLLELFQEGAWKRLLAAPLAKKFCEEKLIR